MHSVSVKKKILVLTPRFPYPVIGGDRLRIYRLCQALSQEYELTLLSLCDSDAEMTMPLPDQVFTRVERLRLSFWRRAWNMIKALPSRRPLQVAYYACPAFNARARELLEQHDATLAHLIRAGDGIRDIPGVKFLEMTDAISLNYQRVSAARGGMFDWRRLIYRFEAKRLLQYEKAVVNSFTHTFLVSEIDKDFLFRNEPASLSRVSVCSNGVDVAALPYHFVHEARDIVFIGNLQSLQNFDAAYFFATEVLPIVRANYPDVRFRVIGRIRPDSVRQLSQLPGVDISGEVSDVAVAASGAALGVCPVRLGAGVQNKVLEYMSLGLPVVSTRLGLEGFAAKPGRDLLVADSPEEMAAAVCLLLEDRLAAASQARCARDYVEQQHSWDAMLSPLVSTVRKYLA